MAKSNVNAEEISMLSNIFDEQEQLSEISQRRFSAPKARQNQNQNQDFSLDDDFASLFNSLEESAVENTEEPTMENMDNEISELYAISAAHKQKSSGAGTSQKKFVDEFNEVMALGNDSENAALAEKLGEIEQLFEEFEEDEFTDQEDPVEDEDLA
ncbi:MAG: hypothetical protein HC796_01265 [Synechococcaceae cyanobacterium RL_1_2]|nr:hypothetical protein [Synechococcaceae cyanobacterium RL_1_2]